jgi:phosphoribosylamine--glycine ligase
MRWHGNWRNRRCLTKLYAAPGNPGIAAACRTGRPRADRSSRVIDFCIRHSIGLRRDRAGGAAGRRAWRQSAHHGRRRCSAPTRRRRNWRGRRASPRICARANIPTAAYVRSTSKDGGLAALDDFALPVVIKADGLAAGKGVTVAMTREEAEEALATCFAVRGGERGDRGVPRPARKPASVRADRRHAILPFGSAQDHKRVGDGDTGPNTGGMGAYSPAPVLTPALERDAIETIVRRPWRRWGRWACPIPACSTQG